MRLRVAFKLHGEEADLARQISKLADVPVDSVAKLAMQRYLNDVLVRAEKAAAAKEKASGQSSQPDAVHSSGTDSDTQDAAVSVAPSDT